MQKIVLVGSGGCMREIVWQMQEQNKLKKQWSIVGYVDGRAPANSGIMIGKDMIPYLGNDDFLLQKSEVTSVAICVGKPDLRKKIAEKLRKNPNLKFPNIILGNTYICEDVQMGQGCIISMDARISTNVSLGDFVFMNIGSKICHDGKIASYVTLSPDATLAGNVVIEENTEIGLGASVIQGITVGKHVVVGAGAVVIRNIKDECTVVGVPAENILCIRGKQ